MSMNMVHLDGEFVRYERLAAGTIKPGMLIEFTGNTFRAHSTSGGRAAKLFANEDSLQGNDMDTSYTTGNLVSANAERSGNRVNALLLNGQNVAIGAHLMSAGNGYLRAMEEDSSSTLIEKHAVAIALEAVDMSDSSSADPDGRIQVMVL